MAVQLLPFQPVQEVQLVAQVKARQSLCKDCMSTPSDFSVSKSHFSDLCCLHGCVPVLRAPAITTATLLCICISSCCHDRPLAKVSMTVHAVTSLA